MYLTCSDNEGYLGREKSTLNNESTVHRLKKEKKEITNSCLWCLTIAVSTNTRTNALPFIPLFFSSPTFGSSSFPDHTYINSGQGARLASIPQMPAS